VSPPADGQEGVPFIRKRPVLLVLHQEHSTPGRIGTRLRALGHPLDIRRPRFGDPLPKSLENHAGAVIFGGPMSVNDSDDFLKEEIGWLATPLAEGVPFLGLCLGAQMLASHLGARVAPHADSHVEVGWYGLRPTEAGKKLIDWPDYVHHFHREGFELPAGATLLAEGEAAANFANQAFSFGATAYAIQFHVELTTAMVGRWTRRSAERGPQPGRQSTPMHLQGRALHDWKTVRFLDRFLDLWLAADKRAKEAIPEAAE
jgi:GMP synthase (glutamine-hydrolysing)